MRHIVTLAATAAFALAPALALAQTPASPPAPAAIPDQTIGKAGAALHDVAKVQQKYQGQMDSASPEQKKGLSEQANAEAVQAIQSHGISVQEYTTVMRTAQNNPQVKQRLLSAAQLGN
ncbi:MAG TPA: DUF4168 domain-containing protein [Rhodopila sp.]|jgi:hypothetical protein